MSDETGAQDNAAWKSKVRSLDDTLKSLRSGTAKSKSRPREKAKQPEKEHGRGIFAGLHGRPAHQVVPIEPGHQS